MNLTTLQQDILACAARLITEEGLDYHAAKLRAIKLLGLPPRTALPSNTQLEDAVQEHIAIFLADTQPAELQTLRQIALKWMHIMRDFAPLLSGAVWHGTATQHSNIQLQLFSDDTKAAEIHLLNQNVRFTTTETTSLNQDRIYTLCVAEPTPQWFQNTLILMALHHQQDIRGSLTIDDKGRKPRGDCHAVQQLVDNFNPTHTF